MEKKGEKRETSMKIFFPNVVCVSIVDCSEMVSLEVEPYDNYGLPANFRCNYETSLRAFNPPIPPSLPPFPSTPVVARIYA